MLPVLVCSHCYSYKVSSAKPVAHLLSLSACITLLFFFFASEATAITSGLSLVFNAVALNTLLYTEELLNTAIYINYDHTKLAIGTCSITKITATAKPSKTKQQVGQAKFRQRKPDKDQS